MTAEDSSGDRQGASGTKEKAEKQIRTVQRAQIGRLAEESPRGSKRERLRLKGGKETLGQSE